MRTATPVMYDNVLTFIQVPSVSIATLNTVYRSCSRSIYILLLDGFGNGVPSKICFCFFNQHHISLQTRYRSGCSRF